MVFSGERLTKESLQLASPHDTLCVNAIAGHAPINS